MTTAFHPVTLPETTTPASRIMRERDEAQAQVADLGARTEILRGIINSERQTRYAAESQLSEAKAENARLIRENARLLAKAELDKGYLAAYRDALVAIYDASRGQTGPVVDTIHSMMRELADGDLYDDDPMFDTCQTCGPFDRDDNPMPGCRDCFGGKVVR